MRHSAALALLSLPGTALPEVLDKVAAPWEPRLLLPLAAVTGLCAFLAAYPGRLQSSAALALAVTWSAAGFSWDPLYDPHLGPAIRRELPAATMRALEIATPVSALLPLAIACGLICLRELPRRDGRQP